jgi:oxygen-independent coproporphyrinogen-3 oxidase
MESLFGGYVEALTAEICAAPPADRPLDSVYFGGGTPTVLSPDVLAGILSALRDRFGLAGDAEVTVEANPGTVEVSGLAALRRAGFNRLSIGIQSFDDAVLARIGRIHTAEEAREAVAAGRGAGFNNISIDLMYALPEQSISDWRCTIESALDLAPEHISLYELTVEEGTVFGGLHKERRIRLPDEDLQIEMYTTATRTLTAAGYEHYEISNFALPGRRSHHNQTYWRNEPYFGFGAGASGYVSGARYTNLKSPDRYIERVRAGGSAVETSETLTGRRAMGETLMLGLRMLDGLDLAAFRERFGVDLDTVYRRELTGLANRGLVELTEGHLRLTPSGLLVANDVAAEFL